MNPSGSSPSRAALQKSSNIKIALGFVAAVAGRLLSISAAGALTNPGAVPVQPANPTLALVGSILSIVGSILFIWGCVEYAKSKGYSGWWGALGLLSCIGLLILVLMPNKWVDSGFNPTDTNSNYPR